MPKPIRTALAVLLLVGSWPLGAKEIDLAAWIAPGDWALSYQRVGVFKPLQLKKKEDGVSHTCLDGDPRRQLIDWLAAKGCSIQAEAMRDGVYRLEGVCTMKWWKSHPIPVSVELHPENRKAFRLTIRTGEDSLLAFEENTTATHQGECASDR